MIILRRRFVFMLWIELRMLSLLNVELLQVTLRLLRMKNGGL